MLIILYFINKKNTKKSPTNRLQSQKADGKITTMNTLNTLINSISQTINENVIDSLESQGFTHREATKMVVESNFSLVEDSIDNPVESF